MVITTSGSIASFKTPVKQPLKSLKVYFSPIQNGSGDPSPTNIRPITGWTGLTAYEVRDSIRKALTIEDGYYDETGSPKASSSMRRIASYVSTSPGAQNVICGVPISGGSRIRIQEYDSEQTWIRQVFVSDPVEDKRFVCSWTTSSDASYFRASWPRCTTAGAMSLYTNIDTRSVDWTSEAGTLYGGYVDLISGELVQTHYGMQINRNTITSMKMDKTNETYTQAYFINSNNSIPKFKAYTGLSNRFKCLNTTVAEVNSFINFGGNVYFMIPSADLAAKDVAGILDWFDANPTFLVAELSTPVTYQLQPVQLETLIGRNNIFSDADTVEAVYDHVDTTDMVRLRLKVLKCCQMYKTALPPGYEEYDYLQRVGSDSRIDTGVDGTRTDLKFAFTYMPTSIGSYGCLFGNYTSEDTKCWRILHVAATASDADRAFYVTARNNRAGASPKLLAVPSGESFINKKIDFELEMASAKSTIDGYTNTVSVSETGAESPSERTIAISAPSPVHSGATSTLGRFYGHFKIWGGTELIHEYVPAVRLSDNKAGFYDLVNYTFNPSIGTADFIPGNDIGGLYVYADNSRYYEYVNGTVDANVITDSDYFLTGFYDTGSDDTKSYTVSVLVGEGNVCTRFFNDKTATSVNYFNISTAYETRTFSTAGRYIMATVYKPRAADFYIYDNTNQRYIVKGSNVT